MVLAKVRRLRLSGRPASNMTKESEPNPRLRSWFECYVRFAVRRRFVVLVVVGLLSLGMGLLARGVGVDSRLQALLPANTASARSLGELKERLQSASPLYLLVQSSDIDTSRHIARRLATRVTEWPETRWVMSRRDPTFFLQHRLLYLSAPDLLQLDDTLAERHRWEECNRLPGCENLDDEAPPLPTDADLQALFEKEPNVKALASLFGNDTTAFSTTPPPPAAAAGTSKASDNEAELGELCDVETRTCTVQVALEGDPDDLVFARSILARSEHLFSVERAGNDDPALKMAVSGPYRNAAMTQDSVSRDLQMTTLVSLVLVLLVVVGQFRGWASIVVLLVPAALGILWALGPLGAAGVRLNVISVFTLAVLAGVGIDFGVHLTTHYSQCRKELDTPSALVETLTHLAPSMLVAAGTTSAGFGALAAASFRGFSEMGPIAAFGVASSLLAYFVLFPPLVAVLDGEFSSKLGLRVWGGVRWSLIGRWRRTITRSLLALAGLGLLIGSGAVSSGVGFEYDLRKLRPAGVGHGIHWGSTLHGTARTSVYLLSDERSALDVFASEVRAAPPEEVVDSTSPFVVIPSAFIPPDQTARLAAIAGLRKTLLAARTKASGNLLERIDAFLPLTDVTTPVELAELPAWVRDWLVERDGRFGTLGVLYSKLSGSDARAMEVLSNTLEQWRQRYPGVRFASPVAQLGEVTPRLRAEAPTILGLALAGVLFGTLLVGRSLRRAVVVLMPLALTMALTMGAMVLFDVRVNLYNMLVFPLAFGIGVDGAIYVVWAMRGDASARKDPLLASGEKPVSGDEVADRLGTAARAVLGSTLTSIAGFGALMASSNPGLFSIGKLCALTLGISILINLIWLPAMLWRAEKRTAATVGHP